jgi:hypothetical protein
LEITNDISEAISQHQEAVKAVSEALGPYRTGSDGLAADADPERQLDHARERYEQSSLALTGLISGRLVISSESGNVNAEGEGSTRSFDDDATTRLTILINIDARVAEHAGVLAEAQAPAADGDVPYPRALTSPELADLGRPLADVCAPMFTELRQDEEADATPERAVDGEGDNPDVKEFFDAILNRAGGDIVGTIASSLSWLNRISAVLASPTASFVTWSNDALKQGISALHRLLSGAWRGVLTKVMLLVGQHAAQVGQIGADIIDKFKVPRTLAARGTGFLLGKILKIAEVSAQAQDLVIQNPTRAGAAIAACQRVNKHHQKRRKAVPYLNKALPACRLVPASGVALEAVAATTLLIYNIWLAHDHLDSPVLANLRLPKNPGMLSNIRAAVR